MCESVSVHARAGVYVCACVCAHACSSFGGSHLAVPMTNPIGQETSVRVLPIAK